MITIFVKNLFKEGTPFPTFKINEQKFPILNDLNNEEVVIAMRTLGRLIGSCAMTPLLLGIAWDVKLYFTITHSDKFIKNWDGKTALSFGNRVGRKTLFYYHS